jgi:hypothetical protein
MVRRRDFSGGDQIRRGVLRLNSPQSYPAPAGRTTTEENRCHIVIPAEAGIYPAHGHRPSPV